MSEKPSEFLILRVEGAEDLPLPCRATPLSAGMDLHANVCGNVVIGPGKRKLIPTGIKIALPYGYEAQVRPRSGLALHHGISMLNAPATIDADYRGEVGALLLNSGEEPYTIRRGDRIAQIVICPIALVQFTETDILPESVRGEGGYGHSGR